MKEHSSLVGKVSDDLTYIPNT